MRSLLAMLLLDAGRDVSADRLADGLYGSSPPADVGHALQSQVSRLRRGLKGAAEALDLAEAADAELDY